MTCRRQRVIVLLDSTDYLATIMTLTLGIRSRAVLLLALLGALLAAFAYPFGSHGLDRTLEVFERAQIQNDLERVAFAIGEDGKRLRLTAWDYGNWDDALEYMRGENPSYIEDNFDPEVLAIAGADFAFIVGSDKRIHWSARANASLDGMAPLRKATVDAVTELFAGASTRDDLELHPHFVWIGDECLSVGISSVANTRGTEFSGWLGFGKWLDQAHRGSLRLRTSTEFELLPVSAEDLAAPPSNVIEIGSEHFAAQHLLYHGEEPVLRIHSAGERPLAMQQAQAARLLRWAIVFTVLAGLLMTYLILHVVVIKRIRALSRWARERRDVVPTEPGPTSAPADEIDGLRADFEALTQDLERVTERWKVQARQDWLTQIGNRAKLMDDLGNAHDDSDGQHALLLLDLDQFKAVNDLMGHHSGDELLRSVAALLAAQIPEHADVYRIGGDEFAVLWRNVPSADALESLTQTLLDALRLSQGAVGVSASIGIVSLENQLSANDWLMQADVALYSAKQAGRGRARYFTEQDLTRFREHFELERQFKQALDEGRINVHFQPIIDARDRRIVAVEALARWTLADGQDIPPSRFIPVAERSKLITQLDVYVLERSCLALARLQENFAGLVVNINVSPISLQGGTFIRTLADTLASTKTDPAAVRLELTEGGASLQSSVLEDAVVAIRAQGVAIVIDDFGVGASSLDRLNRLRPNGLKLDGSFVRDCEGGGGRICRAVVELARELGMDLTAECVETHEQERFLLGIGCHVMQGHYYSPALSEGALPAWIDSFRRLPVTS